MTFFQNEIITFNKSKIRHRKVIFEGDPKTVSFLNNVVGVD